MSAAAAWWPELPRIAGALAGCAPQAVEELLEKGAVCREAAPAGRRTSSLNNDGTPVELSVTAAPGGRTVRLLMDPAHAEPDPELRRERGLEACARLSAGLAPGAFERALRAALPGPVWLRSGLPYGCLWLGADLPRRGIAAYLSARWGPPQERWPRVLEWFASLSAAPLPGALPEVGEPASVALAAAPGAALRVKLYFRLRRPCPLGALGLGELAAPEVEWFVARLIGDRSVRRSGLLLSVEASAGSRSPIGSKIDLCAHCLAYGAGQWAALIEELAGELGLADPGVSGFLRAGQAAMAFIGLGRAGACWRLNCYLKAAGGWGGPRG